MVYATELVQQYRSALAYRRNTHFWNDRHFQQTESVFEFNRLKLPLFIALIGNRLNAAEYGSAEMLFGSQFKVVPRKLSGGESPLAPFIAQSGDLRWEVVKERITAIDLDTSLIDLFDWEEEYWRDFRLCRVLIHKCEPAPSLVGREALLEINQVDVIWHETQVTGMPRRVQMGTSSPV